MKRIEMPASLHAFAVSDMGILVYRVETTRGKAVAARDESAPCARSLVTEYVLKEHVEEILKKAEAKAELAEGMLAKLGIVVAVVGDGK